MKGKDLLSIADLEAEEIGRLIKRAIEMKGANPPKSLAGRTVVLLFEKPSLRTRASFDVGIHHLGGYSLYMGGQEVGLGVREPVADVARVMARYVDCIVARVNAHESLEELARHASVPVINALSNWEHPCQTLADLQTIWEAKGRLKGVPVAYVGDGNNVARSLALGVASVGGDFAIASPTGYGLDEETLKLARRRASEWGATVSSLHNVQEAISGAEVVYTDVWTSMGQDAEREARLKAFRGYTVDQDLMSHAHPQAIFMHPMPTHYGEEVPHGMLDRACSVAFHQAENRLHAQKSLLEHLVGVKQG